MTTLGHLLLVGACTFIPAPVQAAQAQPALELELPAVLSSGCVLQRNARVPVWGKGKPGRDIAVQVSWSGKTYTGRVRPSGDWWIPVPTPEAGGPYQIGVRCGKTDIVIEDILIGEVWVASGQSNMEMPLGPVDDQYSGVEDYESELESAEYPMLRLFNVENDMSLQPEGTCEGAWQACTPKTARAFSATAYFFGRELQRELGVPVGLITADYGGTRAEAWMSASALSAQPGFEQIGALLGRASTQDSVLDEAQTVAVDQWFKELAMRVQDRTPAWMSFEAANADPTWQGLLWLRLQLPLETPELVNELMLDMGEETIWLTAACNGEDFASNTPRPSLDGKSDPQHIPSRLLRQGDNEITVCLFGSTDLSSLQQVQSRLTLAEQPELVPRRAGNWEVARALSVDEFSRFPEYSPLGSNTPTALFNAMIAPIMPYGIRGVIWYQGESNTDRPDQYRSLFPGLIADWRKWWRQGDFPFYFVQIAPYAYPLDGELVARLRTAQRESLSVANTGMVVTLDIGDTEDVHPKNKQSVGRRLALWALAKDYGREDLVYSGPLDTGVEVNGSELRVRFEHIGGGLVAAEGGLRDFQLAGRDGVFHSAKASIDGDEVRVTSDAVPSPVKVHYCFGAADIGTLFNREGLPASPFER